jgi:hypothetical protein
LAVALVESNLARRERLAVNKHFAGYLHIGDCDYWDRRYQQSTNRDHGIRRRPDRHHGLLLDVVSIAERHGSRGRPADPSI